MSITNDGSEWPDFLLPPRVGSTIREDSYTVTGPDEEVISLLVPDLDTFVLRLASGVGLSERIKVAVAQYSGDAGELVPVAYGYAVVYGFSPLLLPISTLAPKIVITAVSASSYSQSLVYKLVTRQGIPATVGVFGSVPNALFDWHIAATSDEEVRPEICMPSEATIYVETNATAWTLSLRVWGDLTPTDFLIANDVNPIVGGKSVTLPGTAYAFVLHNGDGVQRDFTLGVLLKP